MPSKAPIPTPTIYAGKLYVSGGFHNKEIYCFDAASGAPVWGRRLDDDGPTSGVCEDGVVVFNTESCTVFALNAETGEMLWSHWLGDPLTSTPTIAGGRVFTSYPAIGGGAPETSGLSKNAPKSPMKQNAVDPLAEDPTPADKPLSVAAGMISNRSDGKAQSWQAAYPYESLALVQLQQNRPGITQCRSRLRPSATLCREKNTGPQDHRARGDEDRAEGHDHGKTDRGIGQRRPEPASLQVPRVGG